MSSKFERLPLELHRAIISEYAAEVGEYGRVFCNWISTCSLFRELLAPRVFARMGLEMASGLIGCKVASFIKRINYYFSHWHEGDKERIDHEDYEESDDDEDGEECTDDEDYEEECNDECLGYPKKKKILPAGVGKALANLVALQNLEALDIGFEVFFDWTELLHTQFGRDAEETSMEVIEAETTQGWRAMMASELSIDFVLREVSTFSTPGWHRFLNQLRKFSIDIPGGDSGAGWELAAWHGYPLLTAKFDRFFFDHLTNVEHFTLHAHETGALGPLAPLALRPEHLSRVRHIDLCNVFISRDLVDLLKKNAPYLETVILRDIMANGDCEGWFHIHPTWSGDVTWAHLLNSVADANPPYLTVFDVQPSRWPDTWDEIFDGSEGKEEHVEMKEFLKQHPGPMVFYYGTHHDKYKFRLDAQTESSMAAGDGESRGTAHHFYLGEDQHAYNRLMAIVERNRSTLRAKSMP